MAFKNFKKQFLNIESVNDPKSLLLVINSIQAAIEDSITTLVSKFQNDSILLTNIKLNSGKINIINHSLGKKLIGWQIVRQRNQSQIWDNQDNNKSQNLTLLLSCSSNVEVDILVF